MSSAESDVLAEDFGNKGVITLNRPKALNSLNQSMVEKLYPILSQWEKEKTLVIVKGAGEKAFCAGGDVKAIAQEGLKGNRQLGLDFFRKEYMTNGLIGTYAIPYIAIIDGITMGGGVGLSVHGHYRIATERTLFAMPETQIGLFPDVGGSFFLPRLGGKLGTYLALTGVRLKGYDVHKAGIATHYVESKSVGELEKALLECESQKEIQETLAKFHVQSDQEFSLKPRMNQIDKCFSGESMEQIVDNLRADGSQWAQETMEIMKKMSPTSLKVTLKQLKLGATMELHDCLQMEYRLAANTLAAKDFFEGEYITNLMELSLEY